MLSLASPHEPTSDERKHFLKAARGVRNNANAAIDEINRGFSGWRHLAKEYANQTGMQAHAPSLGPINLNAIFTLAAKLGMAFYYRETGRIVPNSGAIVVDVITNVRLLRNDIPEYLKFNSDFRPLTRHDPRNQFLYRDITLQDSMGGMFQFAVHLNYLLVSLVVEDREQHPVDIANERTFLPGFLRSISPLKDDFMTARPSKFSACYVRGYRGDIDVSFFWLALM